MATISGPLHPFRQRFLDKERVAVVAALTPGLALGVVLVETEVGEPVTFAIALIDGFLKVAVLASCVGLLVAWLMPTPTAARAAVFVAGTGLATAFTVLAQREPGPAHSEIAYWAASAAILDAAAGWFLLWHRNLIPASHGAVLAGLLALALPLTQFWHQTTWSDSTEKASLGVAPAVEVQGTSGDDLMVNVQIELLNAGADRVRVIHSAVDVCQWSADADDITYVFDEMRDRAECVRWRAFSPRSWLDAGAELEGSKLFRVPRSRPHLVVVARVAYARGDRLQLPHTPTKVMDSAPDADGEDGRCDDVEFYRIEDDSRGRELAQANKYLGYADRQGRGRTSYFLLSGDPVECQNSDDDLEDFYGVTELSTIAETWLVPGGDQPVSQPLP